MDTIYHYDENDQMDEFEVSCLACGVYGCECDQDPLDTMDPE